MAQWLMYNGHHAAAKSSVNVLLCCRFEFLDARVC